MSRTKSASAARPGCFSLFWGAPKKETLMLIQCCQTLGPSAKLSAKGTKLSPVASGAAKPPQATRVASTPEPHSPGAHVSPAGIYVLPSSGQRLHNFLEKPTVKAWEMKAGKGIFLSSLLREGFVRTPTARATTLPSQASPPTP